MTTPNNSPVTPVPGPPTHRQIVLRHLSAVEAMQAHLTEVYSDPLAENRAGRISAAHASIRTGLKMAEIHSLLSIAEAFREWTEVDVNDLIAGPTAVITRLHPSGASYTDGGQS